MEVMRLFPALILFSLLSLSLANKDWDDPERLAEEEGYYKREHSLTQPYQGRGMDIPFWEFGGSTVVTNDYVRLTPDRQSKQGSLWNHVPVGVHNWEILIHFHVHGAGKTLFGDGFAIWYTKERNVMGPVFGNQDYFVGLGVFFDTYSNHNGEHAHEHPYISAMVNNGSLHYDHDRDGTHSQMAGCHAKFRNSDEDTLVAISYINRQLILMTNINGGRSWEPCFVINDVDLPTGYYIGFTATTGDLADNHDIISVKLYDVESQDPPTPPKANAENTVTQEPDWSTVVPRAASQELPRPHVEDSKPFLKPFWYRFFSVTMLGVLIVVFVGVVGGVIWKRRHERNKKRFF
ncbi:PREDICTED: vesicular integral-membrane protein VIP36-like [Amphimedon queenslandica]|uniref:L-type lectin-like domain-containing protein n=1 Tax=Amphimedon queenslandica TaxID=400682 RepID=A0A1X7VDR9_AMPQE|nr:PREDICTED: vesicular integral-membrane protein VIP36-like [Amphimedon queenslandica]|eukprot:XP_003384673.1 PREDICTED: vesicular integral-membrane protein VIP36-like [Amphimedon queenslandica]